MSNEIFHVAVAGITAHIRDGPMYEIHFNANDVDARYGYGQGRLHYMRVLYIKYV